MKRMKHPDHGFHHVYDGNQEAAMRAAGWTDAEAASPSPETPPEADAEEAPARRVRGPNKFKAG